MCVRVFGADIWELIFGRQLEIVVLNYLALHNICISVGFTLFTRLSCSLALCRPPKSRNPPPFSLPNGFVSPPPPHTHIAHPPTLAATRSQVVTVVAATGLKNKKLMGAQDVSFSGAWSTYEGNHSHQTRERTWLIMTASSPTRTHTIFYHGTIESEYGWIMTHLHQLA